ncbi:TetR/AcrR family transcriptional regulator [Kitasatospora sp. NBC_00085]|uniref:TetR/AcrR family transcriptional regulator n=1 Tax=unclassified Kitasatospora TaxID=2633591 RepID=UPI002F90C520
MSRTPASGAPAARSRADAVRNQRLLTDAAARSFAAGGLGVPVSQIVREAGLGKGTVFRCFPTKDHLVAAIAAERLDELTELAEALATGADPAAALYSFMQAAARLFAADRGFFESLSLPPHAHPEVLAAEGKLTDAVDVLLGRAQEDGAVRADISTVDVLLLLGGIRQAAAPLLATLPDLWQRYLDVVFAGLRTPAPGAPEPADAGTGAPSRAHYRRAVEALGAP